MTRGRFVQPGARRRALAACVAWLAGVLASAPGDSIAAGAETPRAVVATFDFSRGDFGWTGAFADYPAGSESFYELEFDRRPMPPDVRGGRPALRLHGVNRSDDLFMFAKGPIEGLVPGANYRVTMNVVIGSSAPTGAVGIGGAPGESVFLKAGATTMEPGTVVDRGFVLADFDKGNQSVDGASARLLGHAGVRKALDDPRVRLKPLPWGRRREPVVVTAGPDGRIWALVGSDSGFEGATELWIVRVQVRVAPVK